ncbi:hypothetical protein CEXT_815031 [Caerostris extrusa]|uniref:Uncharacterized protein n=1 Tax=Caerostris extrusa TaxID=172846 RepID=A0AAV4R6K0_CAEEX|nr:hypothetical protein CEXT_815031 [Caerostris extrusa]
MILASSQLCSPFVKDRPPRNTRRKGEDSLLPSILRRPRVRVPSLPPRLQIQSRRDECELKKNGRNGPKSSILKQSINLFNFSKDLMNDDDENIVFDIDWESQT